jgi:4-amino-4-deoxy-L-arabinose transferase-like glycosyltransferase
VVSATTFLVKLVILGQLQGHPLLQPDAGLDTTSYITLAHRVVSGDIGLGPGLYYLSPLYVYFLALALAVSDSLTFVRVVQIALGTAAVGFVFLSARAWFGERAGRIAAALAACTGVFTFYEIVIMQSALDTFLTAAGLWCLTNALGNRSTGNTRQSVRAVFAAGLVFGLQTLNRPNVAIAVAVVAVALVVIRQMRLAILMGAGVSVALLPVVARNAVVSHQFALASSQGGLNFYIGNRSGATGQYTDVPGVRADIDGQSEDTRRVAEQAAGHPLSDADVSGYFFNLGLAWIRSHPAAALKLFVRKIALVFNARHQWLDFSYPYYAFDTGSWLWMLFVGPWLLVPLGLGGLFVVPRDRRVAFAGWAAFVPGYAISVALFFVAERYRLPLFVPLCITAAGMIDYVLALVTARKTAG